MNKRDRVNLRGVTRSFDRLRLFLQTDKFKRALAVAIVFLLPIGSLGVGGIATLNLGVLLSLAIVPIWFRSASSYRGARALQILMLAAIACGLVLLLQTTTTHEIVHQRAAALPLTMFFSAFTLGVLLWARQVTNIATLGVSFGAGALIESLIRMGEWGENAWKYGYAWPCAVIALSLVIGRKKEPLWSSLIVAAIVGVSIGGGYRSLVAFAVVALALYLFTIWNTRGSSVRRGIRFGLVVVATPVLAFVSFSWLLLGGALGSIAQTRTEEQIAESGSIVAGGRQEWAAAVALFRENPLGFGPGVVPNPEDISVGKAGLATIGANVESYHVNTYLFGGQFRFHGIASDLWASFGLVGLGLAAVLLVAIGWFLWRSGVAASTSTIQTLLALWAVWDIVFSPLDSNWRYLIFTISIVLLRDKEPDRGRQPSAFNFWRRSDGGSNPSTTEAEGPLVRSARLLRR